MAAKTPKAIARIRLCCSGVIGRSIYVGFQSDRLRRVTELHRELRRAADLLEFFPIALQVGMLTQRCANFAKNPSRMIVRWISQPVVDPFSFTASTDNLRASQISEVPRNLRLSCFQNRYQKTNAHFRVANQANQPEPGPISQGLKEIFDVVLAS
jgi:hypothetical protein